MGKQKNRLTATQRPHQPARIPRSAPQRVNRARRSLLPHFQPHPRPPRAVSHRVGRVQGSYPRPRIKPKGAAAARGLPSRLPGCSQWSLGPPVGRVEQLRRRWNHFLIISTGFYTGCPLQPPHRNHLYMHLPTHPTIPPIHQVQPGLPASPPYRIGSSEPEDIKTLDEKAGNNGNFSKIARRSRVATLYLPYG